MLKQFLDKIFFYNSLIKNINVKFKINYFGVY